MLTSHKPQPLLPRLIPFALLGLLLLGLCGVVRVYAQANKPNTYPVGAPPLLTPIPVTDDPDAPGISREERFRRARMLLQQQEEMAAQYRERRDRGEAVFTPIQPPVKGRPYNPVKTPAPAGTTSTLATSSTLTQTSGSKTRSGLDISAQAAAKRATLYLDPAGRTIMQGARFATKVRLLNRENLNMDALHVVLSYPAKNLKPVAVHQNDLINNIKGEPVTKIDPESGVLTYTAALKKPLDGLDIPLLTVVWEGIAPAEGLWILPASDRDRSAIYWGGTSLTASMTGVNNTMAGARISVRASESTTPQGNKFLKPTLESMQPLLIGLPNQNLLRKPSIWLGEPPAGTPLRAGDWLTIDIGIENPDHMAFDEVKLAGRYDPAVLRLVDSDKGNWINTDINILDGPFHSDWPWDLHFADQVDSRRGIFFYHMAMSAYREQPSGVVARIFAQLKQDATSPVITWHFDSDADFDQPNTGIYLLGENVLARGTRLADQSQVGTSIDGMLPGLVKTEKADPKLYRKQP